MEPSSRVLTWAISARWAAGLLLHPRKLVTDAHEKVLDMWEASFELRDCIRVVDVRIKHIVDDTSSLNYALLRTCATTVQYIRFLSSCSKSGKLSFMLARQNLYTWAWTDFSSSLAYGSDSFNAKVKEVELIIEAWFIFIDIQTNCSTLHVKFRYHSSNWPGQSCVCCMFSP